MDEAFWHGGWYGIEDPGRMKFHRSGMLVTDMPGFTVSNELVDFENATFSSPAVIAERSVDGRIGVNRKSVLISYRIGFPEGDGDAAVLELSNSHIPRSLR